MAKDPGQESKGTGQDDPLYKAWLSKGQEHLSRVFGRRLADVLVVIAITLLVFLAVSFVYGLIWYLIPIFSANEKLSATDRKDLVQGFASVAQAAAVGLAGAVGLIGLLFTWRSLRQAHESQAQTQESTRRTLELTEQGQITDRFTRAIEQLGATDETTGKPRLEIRLGGIYALERIARDSRKRDHSTVMEVLTAYVRENARLAPKPSKGSSEGSSTSNEATAEADEGVQQPAPLGPHLPTADNQAILDVLGRAQAGIPDKYHIRLDLRGVYLRRADLRKADLQYAYLQYAYLEGADLQYANLEGTNLEGAILQEANLEGTIFQRSILRGANLEATILRGANLQGANLQGAILYYANLQGANLQEANLQGAYVTYDQLADTLSLQGAIMTDVSENP